MNNYTSMKKTTSSALPALLLGSAAGALASSALLCAAALICVKLGSPPVSAAPLITTVIGAVGAFLAGYIAVRIFGSRGLLIGALAGLLLFGAVLISGSAAGEASLSPMAVKCAVFTVCGAFGGVLRVNKRVKVKRI